MKKWLNINNSPGKKIGIQKEQYFCWVNSSYIDKLKSQCLYQICTMLVPTKNNALIILNGYNPPVTGPLQSWNLSKKNITNIN